MREQTLILRATVFALILIGLSPPSHANEMRVGRLFTTPQERAELDRMRLSGTSVVSEQPDTSRAPDANITINGYVLRNGSGKSTVWINAKPQHQNDETEGPTILSRQGQANAVALRLSSGRQVHLKAGQSMEIASGQIREGYEQGIVVSGTPPKPATRVQP